MSDRYVDHGNGTVTDTQTGLMWEQHPIATRYTWKKVPQRIADLNGVYQLGGHGDWRLPTGQELVSLVDYTRYDPAIDPIFTTVANSYWSATTNATAPNFAWVVTFDFGFVNDSLKADFHYVRAVRAGSLNIRSLDTLTDENAQLRARLAQVSRLHQRGVANLHGQSPNSCSACLEVWPCRTIALLADIPDACQGAPHASRAACQLERAQLRARLAEQQAAAISHDACVAFATDEAMQLRAQLTHARILLSVALAYINPDSVLVRKSRVIEQIDALLADLPDAPKGEP